MYYPYTCPEAYRRPLTFDKCGALCVIEVSPSPDEDTTFSTDTIGHLMRRRLVQMELREHSEFADPDVE